MIPKSNDIFKISRALFTSFLTPGLTLELYNPLDDWLDWLISTMDVLSNGLSISVKKWSQ